MLKLAYRLPTFHIPPGQLSRSYQPISGLFFDINSGFLLPGLLLPFLPELLDVIFTDKRICIPSSVAVTVIRNLKPHPVASVASTHLLLVTRVSNTLIDTLH